jgi:hypothetical protein
MDHIVNGEKYYHENEPDLLVQLAVIHGQFEIIHPFLDGNGRLGRILIPLFLFEKDILSRPVFYLSAYIEEHKDEYIERLRGLSRDPREWNRWVEFFLKAIIAQADVNLKAAQGIKELYGELKTEMINLTHSEFAVPLLDALFEHPVFPSTALDGREGLPSKQMTMVLLKKLKHTGILMVVREPRGRRAQILALPRLLNLCEGREVMAEPTPSGQPVD